MRCPVQVLWVLSVAENKEERQEMGPERWGGRILMCAHVYEEGVETVMGVFWKQCGTWWDKPVQWSVWRVVMSEPETVATGIDRMKDPETVGTDPLWEMMYRFQIHMLKP